MANWKRNLEIAAEWKQAKNGEISIAKLADIIVQKLKTITKFVDQDIEQEKEEIIEDFTDIANPESDVYNNTEVFDNAMERLYNWGDIPLDAEWNGEKVCWIGVL